MRSGWPAIPLAVALLFGCADGTIVFIDDDDDRPDTITVEGNIRDINPQVAGADIVVFVFTDLEDPGTFERFVKQRSVAVDSAGDSIEFKITQVEDGDLAVVFLQDDVSNPDGTIDVGDPDDPNDDDAFAILEDPDERLRDVRRGETIRITDVDIDFRTRDADAVSIRSVTTPTGAER